MGLIPFVKDRVTFVLFDKDDILIGTLECEATLSANHKRHAKVTDHPVSQGQATTDNVRPDPNGLTLECFWGNYAVDPILFAKRYATGSFTSSEDAYEKLNDIFSNAFRITIKTRLWTYESMVIEDMGNVETVEDGHSLKVSIQFKQIKVAVASTVPRVKAVPTKNGPPKTQGVKATAAPTAAAKQSVLARATDKVGGGILFKKVR